MKDDDLATLEITLHELENICGREVNELLIGGLVGGVLRSSALRTPAKCLSLMVLEVAMFGLLLMFSFPVSFALTRNLQSESMESIFIKIALGIAIGLVAIWNSSMILRAGQFKLLMRLLDEIDRFNELVRAVDMVDRLDNVNPGSRYFENRIEILSALNMTRDSLMSGVMTEKILRENRGLLARRRDLLTHIESNLSALSAIEVTDEASEYSRILNEALQIGMIVQQEMIQVTSYSP